MSNARLSAPGGALRAGAWSAGPCQAPAASWVSRRPVVSSLPAPGRLLDRLQGGVDVGDELEQRPPRVLQRADGVGWGRRPVDGRLVAHLVSPPPSVA